METVVAPAHEPARPSEAVPRLARPVPAPAPDSRRDALVLEAVRRAVTEPGEHRLFRSGKLPGLFPGRTGPGGQAAREALAAGLIETVRTEQKGKFVTEWVRATPRGVAHVHAHDSPNAVIAELQQAIGSTREGVPAWLAEARRELAALSDKFERQAADILARLDGLTDRLDAALRRMDLTAPAPGGELGALVPWGGDALAYLDRRATTGAAGACPLGELFRAVRETFPELTVPEFHAGLCRLHEARALTLAGAGGPPGVEPDPEFAVILGAELCHYANR